MLTHKFRQLKQITEETIDQYCTRLRQSKRGFAIICEFSNSENEIKIQLVEGCLSSRVRRKAIQDDLPLADILAYARSLEITDKVSVCRAKGKSCFACGKQNNFATKCRSRQSARNNIPEHKGNNIQAINYCILKSNQIPLMKIHMFLSLTRQ